ncbi:ATP-binding protein [Alistipes sp. ZOR0009]|uniref:ATP-binding protein n=1 Tax=Alistipes sp. ZOR0009 TaxID=1339253 RepID=UPI0006460D47|nr:ATP-binding protein [Alistipes sp. ZOR0009]
MVKIPFKSIRQKVFISFFVLMALGISAFFYSYLGVLNISEILGNAPASTHKLTLINQTLIKIYESESNARLYSATGDPSYLAYYENQNQQISTNLKELRNISYNAEQQLQLVNILVLQTQKNKVITDLINLKKSKITREDYAILFKSRPDSVEIEMKQKVYSSSNASAATEAPARKRTFFERLKALFKDEKPAVSMQSNLGLQRKIDSASFKQKRKDSSISDLRKSINDMQRREATLAKLMNEKEVELMKKDKILTDRMLFQMTKLNDEEIKINQKQLSQFDKDAEDYTNRIFFLGFSFLFIILIFLYSIFRDIKKSTQMQKQLEDSNIKIQDLLKVKERFLANMSHEIRTPLSAIIGFSDLLLKRQKYSEEDTLAINTSAKHLHAIVNEILDYSKVESNNVEFELTSFFLEGFLKEIAAEMSVKAKEKSIHLRLDISTSLRSIKLDRLRLKQVLLNLVSNAIKFTHEGEVVVSAKERNGHLLLEVADTGIGIPETALTKIFDEFTQADGSVARQFGGTGLGLSISRKLVQQMGGNISVTSTENVGSTFTVEFPIETIKGEEILPANSPVSIPRLASKVLFIDDDNFVRLLIGKILAANSIEFDEASSGMEGIEKSTKEDYGLIITDLHMPGMSGIDAVKAIRKNNPSAKILFLSADMSHSMVQEMKEVGANGILQKPFSEAEILTAISNIIQLKDTTMAPIEPLCDISKVTDFVGDSKEDLMLIVATFVASADESIEYIIQHNRDGNEKDLADRAHKLLTGFRQFGIAKGVEYLREIEKCRNGVQLKDVQQEIAALQTLWINVKRYLEENL